MKASVRIIDSASAVVADIGYTKVQARAAMMEPGGWLVDTPYSDRLLDLLESRTGAYWVVIVDHGVQGSVHGGRLTEVEWDGAVDGVITLSGVDGNAEVASTNTLPEPANLAHPVGSTPRTNYTYTRVPQQVSSSLYELVDDQLNAAAPSYRERPITLTLASLQNLGGTLALECQSPYEPLLDTVRDWALQGGVVADFPLKGAQALYEMTMRVPAEVGFRLSTDNGTPIEWTYHDSAGTLHIVNAGGKGEGVDRPVAAIVGPSDARWGVTIQRFIKASSGTTQAELNAAGLKALEGKAATRGVRAKAVTSRMGVQYRQDYQLGDIVSVVFAGVEYRQLITAVGTTWDRRGKLERIETGQPAMAGVTLGRLAPLVPARPTAGLAAGDLRLRSLFPNADNAVRLAFEVIYARGEVVGADQATWLIEQRVDSGSWTVVKPTATTGSNDLYYVELNHDLAAPSYLASIEYRATLAQAGETTVYSPILLIGELPALPGAPLSLAAGLVNAGGSEASRFTWAVPPDAGVPPADRLEIDRRLAGTTPWTTQADATNPSTGTTTLSHSYTDGDVWEYRLRFVSDYGPGPYSDVVSVTYPAAAGGFFTTSDDGFFTTSDGGFFTVDDS